MARTMRHFFPPPELCPRPCPCGGDMWASYEERTIKAASPDIMSRYDVKYSVWCGRCGATSGACPTLEEAVRRWNDAHVQS